MGDFTSEAVENRRKAIKLPIPGKRNALITSALPYVNNVPHLGNIIGYSAVLEVTMAYTYVEQMSTVQQQRPKPWKRTVRLKKSVTSQVYNSIIPDGSDVKLHDLTGNFAEKVGKYMNQYIESMEKSQKVCVLCNLKLATMQGIKSQATVLAASNSDHTKVELVEPPKTAQVGERITFAGFQGEPEDVLNPKKKVWETPQVDFHTNSNKEACFKEIPFATTSGICTVATISNGSIR